MALCAGPAREMARHICCASFWPAVAAVSSIHAWANLQGLAVSCDPIAARFRRRAAACHVAAVIHRHRNHYSISVRADLSNGCGKPVVPSAEHRVRDCALASRLRTTCDVVPSIERCGARALAQARELQRTAHRGAKHVPARLLHGAAKSSRCASRILCIRRRAETSAPDLRHARGRAAQGRTAHRGRRFRRRPPVAARRIAAPHRLESRRAGSPPCSPSNGPAKATKSCASIGRALPALETEARLSQIAPNGSFTAEETGVAI